jgi:hypothetical protein
MVSPQNLADVSAIMLRFAERTGLEPASPAPRRYLWTDAFAVCVFLSLAEATGDAVYGSLAEQLIAQVHETLGRHRSDDQRSGWISGLDEAEGRRHPTAGGLRIGKRLNERPAGREIDERLEWDQDGQYFHYLTKWMQALARTAAMTGDGEYCRFALELARAAHAAFVYRNANEGAQRMYWKMSIDLSRPLVPSMGQHDPLDALVSYSELEYCRGAHFAGADLPGLRSQIVECAALCAGRGWRSEDPLGIGGLLVDAYRMSQLQARGVTVSAGLLTQVLSDARAGLFLFTDRYPAHAAAAYRLAFRELGLSIGLHAAQALAQACVAGELALSAAAARDLEMILEYAAIGAEFEAFWRSPRNQSAKTWGDHIDINSVMLATCLLPRQFLLV